MGRLKTDNRHLGTISGYEGRWRHSGKAETITIPPRSGENVVLHSITIGTTTASAIVIRDSVDGVMLTLKASIPEGPYPLNVSLKVGRSLIIENPGGSDILIRFSNN